MTENDVADKESDVAFVTVNYNTRHYVEHILAFFRETRLPFRHSLVVVDNGSTDGSRELLASVEGVDYVPLEVNCGYGAAINRGLARSRSRFAVVMNTDVELTLASLTRMWEFMTVTPDASWASPLITYQDGRIQGFIFHPSLLSQYWILKSTLTTKWYKFKMRLARKPFIVPGLMGAFFWLRRSALVELGSNSLFDENYFFYYEDTDLAHRMWNKGLKAYVVPDACMIHYGGGSTSLNARTHFLKNRHRYICHHFGKTHADNIVHLDRLRVRRKILLYQLLVKISSKARYATRLSKYKSELDIYNKWELAD